VSSCTKKICAVEKKKRTESEPDPRLVQGVPLLRPHVAGEDRKQGDGGRPHNSSRDDVDGHDGGSSLGNGRASSNGRGNVHGRGHGRDPVDNGPVRENRAQDQVAQTKTTQTHRQVRAVHGKSAVGSKELWLYVPEHMADKSNAKRKGWWLYAEPDKSGHYYIGPLAVVLESHHGRSLFR
jgi:hypothetical protein